MYGKLIKKIFKKMDERKKKKSILAENPNPKTILMWEHSGWSDSIYFLNWDTRRVTGHMGYIPKVGDILKSKMSSGKIGVFKVEEIEQMTNPQDQFFATVSDLYLE